MDFDPTEKTKSSKITIVIIQHNHPVGTEKVVLELNPPPYRFKLGF